MSSPHVPDVTELLRRIGEGEDQAHEELFRTLYDELHRRAQRFMRGQPLEHSLQATALVHEAYMRLVGEELSVWVNRAHFLSVAAKAMRSVLTDHARRKRSRKRTPPRSRISLEGVADPSREPELDLADLEEALVALEAFDPRMTQAVELRYFAGVSVEETARILGMSTRSFHRHFSAARAWLLSQTP